MDTITKLASLGHLSREQEARVKQKIAEIVKEMDENPSFAEEGMEKLALLGMSGPQWSRAAQGVGALALATTGAQVVGDVYNMAKNAITKAINYKNMVSANPDLATMDPKQVQKIFNTLHNFNPQYASDPSVAGQFVKDQMDLGRVDLNVVQNISNSYKQGRPNAFQQMAQPSTMSGILNNAQTSMQSEAEMEDKAYQQRLNMLKQEGDYRKLMSDPSAGGYYEDPGTL